MSDDKKDGKLEFNNAYKGLFHFLWTDKRIPKQINTLLETVHPSNLLEFGCGLGYFSEFVENNGVKATGIDFSSVAIEKAKKRLDKNTNKPILLEGDVTNLQFDDNQYDCILDIGCFHSLDENDEKKYIIEAHRVLKPNGTLLIWSFKKSFVDNVRINPGYIKNIIKEKFVLEKAEFTQRRLAGSYWYWLKKIV
jgi:ubiquinone/menaquinone biosynthesis C-methylase UbiE